MEDSTKKYPFIAVAGIMGSGKTTAAKLIAKNFKLHLFEENAAGNPFLPLFYKDPKRWAFHTQLFFLKEKLAQTAETKNVLAKKGVLQDVPIYQDRFTYAKAQQILNRMSGTEFKLYEKFYNFHISSLPVPDLIVQLDASLPTIQNRIRTRDRNYEKGVDPNYLKLLRDLQKKWIESHSHLPILRINTDVLDITGNKDHQKEFIKKIKTALKDGLI